MHINDVNKPTIEFIPSPIDGENIEDMKSQLLQDCIAVGNELEESLDVQIGRLRASSKGEWVTYDPVAKSLSNQLGQITVDGIGKVNASKPRRRGEFEWFDPRDCADYMIMPKRLANMESAIEEIRNLLKVKE